MKIISLNDNKSFQKVYKKGNSFVSKNLVTYILKNNLNSNRVGITASKKIGNAVKRNRAKRLIKEAFRLNQMEIKQGYDIVFVARASTTRSRLSYVKNDFLRNFHKLDFFTSS